MGFSEENLAKIREKRIAQVRQIDDMIKKGEAKSVLDASKKLKLHFGTYYEWKRRMAGEAPSKKGPYARAKLRAELKKGLKAAPKVKSLPIPSLVEPFNGGKVFALVGDPKAIMEAVRSLM